MRALAAGWNVSEPAGDAYRVEIRIRHRDGDYRRFAARVNPLRDPTGRIVKWFGVAAETAETRTQGLMDRCVEQAPPGNAGSP